MFLKEEKQLVIPRHGGGGAAKRGDKLHSPAALVAVAVVSPLLGEQGNKRPAALVAGAVAGEPGNELPAASLRFPDGSSPPFCQNHPIWCPRLLLGSPYAGIVKKGFVFLTTAWKTAKFLLFLQ